MDVIYLHVKSVGIGGRTATGDKGVFVTPSHIHFLQDVAVSGTTVYHVHLWNVTKTPLFLSPVDVCPPTPHTLQFARRYKISLTFLHPQTFAD